MSYTSSAYTSSAYTPSTYTLSVYTSSAYTQTSWFFVEIVFHPCSLTHSMVKGGGGYIVYTRSFALISTEINFCLFPFSLISYSPFFLPDAPSSILSLHFPHCPLLPSLLHPSPFSSLPLCFSFHSPSLPFPSLPFFSWLMCFYMLPLKWHLLCIYVGAENFQPSQTGQKRRNAGIVMVVVASE